MSTVLYIDGSPLLLTDIKRNANGKIIHGHVVNGDWELRLNSTELYAFEEWYARHGWGEKLVLRNQIEYTTYEEYETDVEPDMRLDNGDYNNRYNDIIAATDEIRKNKENEQSSTPCILDL